MYVCLCTGATSAVVSQAIAGGAGTTRAVAEECGAGSVCGRCRATVRALIAAGEAGDRGGDLTARDGGRSDHHQP